jgi:hypothetical protein
MNAFTNAVSALALASLATAQYALPAKDVPFIGGNVFKSNDPAVAGYPFSYSSPFDPEQYGGYYYWSVNNDTVSGSNFTGYGTKEGYILPDGATGKYPFFQISEGHPKAINKTKLFGTCTPAAGNYPVRGQVQEDPSYYLRERGLQVDHGSGLLEATSYPWQAADP